MKILYLDLETTGLDTARDRMIEVGLVMEDEATGERESFESLVNPGMSIPSESSEIHGIRDEDVKDQPPLAEVMPKIVAMIGESDVLAGYNVVFDLKVLMAEGRRISSPVPLHAKKVWDMQKIFFHHEPRTLSAAVRYYCDKDIEDAHRALADVEATLDVFKAQRKKYDLDMNDPKVQAYAELSLPLDSNGAFILNEAGQTVMSFGKFKGKVVDTKKQELKNYLSWMIGASFPPDTKAIARALLKGRVPNKENIESLILESSS